MYGEAIKARLKGLKENLIGTRNIVGLLFILIDFWSQRENASKTPVPGDSVRIQK